MVIIDKHYNTKDMERLLARIVGDINITHTVIQYENCTNDATTYPVAYIESVKELSPNYWLIRLFSPADSQALDLLGLGYRYIAYSRAQ